MEGITDMLEQPIMRMGIHTTHRHVHLRHRPIAGVTPLCPDGPTHLISWRNNQKNARAEWNTTRYGEVKLEAGWVEELNKISRVWSRIRDQAKRIGGTGITRGGSVKQEAVSRNAPCKREIMRRMYTGAKQRVRRHRERQKPTMEGVQM